LANDTIAEPTDLTVDPATPRSAGPLVLLAATRPRQWLKNVLVLAAPFAAGRWLQPHVAIGAAVAFAAMTLTAAGAYLINDVRDVEPDRRHPRKRLRPVASGRLSIRRATVAGGVLLVAGPTLAGTVNGWQLVLVVAAYAALTLGYSRSLKNVPGLELAAVAAGFVLRPLAGAAATGVPPSGWFLGVVCAGALMVTLGKRSAELSLPRARLHRPALRGYTAAGLRRARQAAAAVMLGCYLGWALTRPSAIAVSAGLSAVAVTGAVLRYGWCSDRGLGGEPERLLLADRLLQVCAVAWLVAFLVGPGHV